MKFHHTSTAGLAFVAVLFGTGMAALMPPQPGARLALNHDEVYRDLGGSGVATVPLVLEARTDSKLEDSFHNATMAHIIASVKNEDGAAAWRAGNDRNGEHHAEAHTHLVVFHNSMVNRPSLQLKLYATPDASEKAANEATKLAEASIKLAKARHDAASSSRQRPPGYEAAVTSHHIAAAIHRGTADTYRLNAHKDPHAQEEADKYDKIAKGHEESMKDPLKGYGFVYVSRKAALRSSKDGKIANLEAVRYNQKHHPSGTPHH